MIGRQEPTKLMRASNKRREILEHISTMRSALAWAAAKQAMKQGLREMARNISKQTVKGLALSGAIAPIRSGVEAGLRKLTGVEKAH